MLNNMLIIFKNMLIHTFVKVYPSNYDSKANTNIYKLFRAYKNVCFNTIDAFVNII